MQPDVVAPGVSIMSAKAGGGVTPKTGTSQAAPFVAGLAALLMEALPRASAARIESAIRSTAKREEVSDKRVNNGVVAPMEAFRVLGV